MMAVHGLDHATLRCQPAQLAALQDFYCGLLGLVDGARPPFDFPGHWLYAGGRPVLHLAGVLAADADARPEAAASGAIGVLGALAHRTGAIDHLAFTASGLDASRDSLRARGMAFTEAPVPDRPLHQVFLLDPLGVKVELTFGVGP